MRGTRKETRHGLENKGKRGREGEARGMKWTKRNVEREKKLLGA